MQEYLTVTEAALTSRTPKALRKMVERRQIPFRKHGKRIVFKRAEVEMFFDNLPGVSLEEARRRMAERGEREEP
jgi:CelD/BcsL family acetyltransferase involved in cellulose biosynthesis